MAEINHSTRHVSCDICFDSITLLPNEDETRFVTKITRDAEDGDAVCVCERCIDRVQTIFTSSTATAKMIVAKFPTYEVRNILGLGI